MQASRALTTLVVLLVAYASLCGVVAWQQSRLMLFPIREVRLTPGDFAMEYETWGVESSAGAQIQAWKIPPSTQPARAWVLHCHGNGGNISHRLEVARWLHQLQLGVVLFDYRGFGESQGAARQESDLIDDGQAVLDRLGREHPQEPILLYGESLGGGVASALACRNPCAGLVLQSTFSSLRKRASEAYPFLPVSRLLRFPLDTLGRLPHVQCPILVMHSRDDEVIGFHHGQELFEAAPEPKFWQELKGGHNSLEAESWRLGMEALLQAMEGPQPLGNQIPDSRRQEKDGGS